MSMDQNGYSPGRAAYPTGYDEDGRPVFLDLRGKFAVLGRRTRPTKNVAGVTRMPSMAGGRGRMAGPWGPQKKRIKGFDSEQGAVKEAEEAEKRADDWEKRFGHDDNAAVKARKAKAADLAENKRRAENELAALKQNLHDLKNGKRVRPTKGFLSVETERGAARFREARLQDEMGGATHQEALQTGRAPLQDGTISTPTGRMAFKGGNVVGTSRFIESSRRR